MKLEKRDIWMAWGMFVAWLLDVIHGLPETFAGCIFMLAFVLLLWACINSLWDDQ